MTTQTLYLERYEWEVRMFYDVSQRDFPTLYEALHTLGAEDGYIDDCLELLRTKNTGITFTSLPKRESICVISRTSSADEFADTYYHEMGHVVRHISEYVGIAPYSEEEQYLAGDLSRQTFQKAKHYLCDHCRKN